MKIKRKFVKPIVRVSKVDVVTDEDAESQAPPFCEHGPCLLFERTRKDSTESERFYACSVCRNRKMCPFYLPFSKKLKTKRNSVKSTAEGESHSVLYKRLKNIRQLPSDRRYFCVSCQKLILPDVLTTEHSGHVTERAITNVQLKNPSKLLTTKTENDKEAQYWFAKSALTFFAETIQRLNFDGVLCIGAPRLHEMLSSVKYKNTVSSFLLDYDERYAQFFSPRTFARYNMFVNHFYSKSGEKNLLNFLTGISRLLIIIDPPFGGLTTPIAKSVGKLESMFKEAKVDENAEVLKMFILPYFMESNIRQSCPDLTMLDYQVDYENHPLFKNPKKTGSPIRIFTNVHGNQVKLPSDKYKYCDKCDRYVAKWNKHCVLCKTCPSKDGKTYVHCKVCTKCVKPTYKHCAKCGRCHLPNIPSCILLTDQSDNRKAPAVETATTLPSSDIAEKIVESSEVEVKKEGSTSKRKKIAKTTEIGKKRVKRPIAVHPDKKRKNNV